MSIQSICEDEASKNQSDSLSIFCREVRNLLRSKANCMIPFSKFVPAYHNHYGRQCCVYQFGYTKLIELLESIPHVVQIVGDGTNRYITLTHREQIKRFASDLIKVVKSQPGKKLKLSQFGRAYEQVLGRAFRVEDYGTNNINVLLAEIWEGTINIMPIKREFVDSSIVGPLFVGESAPDSPLTSLITPPPTTTASPSTTASVASSCNNNNQGQALLNQLVAHSQSESSGCAAAAALVSNQHQLVNKPYITESHPDAWFEIPKRERSDREIRRTKYFVWDVIELLSKMEPDYSVAFSKFIPSYHYYFNRQCKVSIFGFSKLIDLFESISPEVVEIIDQGPGEEKIIKLASQHVRRKLTSNNSQARGRPHLRVHHPARGHQAVVVAGGGRPACVNIYQRRRSVGSISPNQEESCPSEVSDEEANHCQVQSSTSSDRESFPYEDEKEVDQDVYDDDDDDDDQDEDGDDDDDDYEDLADDLILPAQAMDSGPTEEELMELEDELKAYEELKAIQSKRSSRMAAILDIFKYSIY